MFASVSSRVAIHVDVLVGVLGLGMSRVFFTVGIGVMYGLRVRSTCTGLYIGYSLHVWYVSGSGLDARVPKLGQVRVSRQG